jgi:hypothetical protein
MWRVGAMLLAGSVAACSVDKQQAPALVGPSGSAQSVTLSASPDHLAHDGTAQSTVTVTVLDANAQPVSGLRVGVAANTGTLSNVDVVTASDGRASFTVKAPALSTPATNVTVQATAFGTNADNALPRTLTIGLTGTLNATAPSPSFTFSPESPVVGDAISFDASATTDEGGPCGTRCTYLWSYGEGSSGGGMFSSRIYSIARTYVVTLTVTDNAGTVASTQRAVTVVDPAPPAAGP